MRIRPHALAGMAVQPKGSEGEQAAPGSSGRQGMETDTVSVRALIVSKCYWTDKFSWSWNASGVWMAIGSSPLTFSVVGTVKLIWYRPG